MQQKEKSKKNLHIYYGECIFAFLAVSLNNQHIVQIKIKRKLKIKANEKQ